MLDSEAKIYFAWILSGSTAIVDDGQIKMLIITNRIRTARYIAEIQHMSHMYLKTIGGVNHSDIWVLQEFTGNNKLNSFTVAIPSLIVKNTTHFLSECCHRIRRIEQEWSMISRHFWQCLCLDLGYKLKNGANSRKGCKNFECRYASHTQVRRTD